MWQHGPAGQVAVVVPIYRAELAESERISLDQCVAVLGAHQMVLVHPASLEAENIAREYGIDRCLAFPDECFASYHSYNRTMRSSRFYREFLEFSYILLYQLDSFVFADSLIDWCQRGFDYIGAPLGAIGSSNWEYCRQGYLPFWSPLLHRRSGRNGTSLELFNGGLSLRRTRTFYRICRIYRRRLSLWGKNEDLFWSAVAGSLYPGFRLPTADEATRFAIMVNARQSLDRLGGELPFGCHGWDRYDPEVWSPLIQQYRAA